MRFFAILLLIVFLVVLAAFAFSNRESLEVRFPFIDSTIQAPSFLIMLAIYVFGMLTGWTVIAAIRTSLHRASEHHDH